MGANGEVRQLAGDGRRPQVVTCMHDLRGCASEGRKESGPEDGDQGAENAGVRVL